MDTLHALEKRLSNIKRSCVLTLIQYIKRIGRKNYAKL